MQRVLLGMLKSWDGTECAHDCIMACIKALLQVQLILQRDSGVVRALFWPPDGDLRC